MTRAYTHVLQRPVFWIALVMGAAVGLCAGVAWTSSRSTTYVATETSFVAFEFPPEERDPFSGLLFVTQRIDSYVQLGRSPEVLQAAAADVGDRRPTELQQEVAVTVVPGTVLVRVAVTDTDRIASLRLADAVTSHLGEAIASVEAGAPQVTSPIRLVPVQPAVVSPASSLLDDLAADAGGLIVGALVGAVTGFALSRIRVRPTNGRRLRRTRRRRDEQRAGTHPENGVESGTPEYGDTPRTPARL